MYQSQSTGFFGFERVLFVFVVCFNSVVFDHLPIILTFIWLALWKKVLYITFDLQIITGLTQTEGKVCTLLSAAFVILSLLFSIICLAY